MSSGKKAKKVDSITIIIIITIICVAGFLFGFWYLGHSVINSPDVQQTIRTIAPLALMA